MLTLNCILSKNKEVIKMNYSPRTISVDHETWEKARDIIKEETGMTMSKFIEIYLRGIARAKRGGIRDVIEGATKDLIEMDDSASAREKIQMFDVVKQNKDIFKKKKK
jgi:antitoxin component of RelBE/YafQ-DinJ toxin-antitoxin module